MYSKDKRSGAFSATPFVLIWIIQLGTVAFYYYLYLFTCETVHLMEVDIKVYLFI
jgi:hypothetical protein